MQCEEGQEDFEDRATRVILVGRLDVASDDMGSRYLIKKRSLSVGERRRNAKKGEYEDFRLPKEICLDFFLKKKEICASSLHICRLPGEAERVGHRANGTAVDADRDFTVQ